MIYQFYLGNLLVDIPKYWEFWKSGFDTTYLREQEKKSFFVIYKEEKMEYHVLKNNYWRICRDLEEGKLIKDSVNEEFDDMFFCFAEYKKKRCQTCRVILAWKRGYLYRFKFYGKKFCYNEIRDYVLEYIVKFRTWEDHPQDTFEPVLDKDKFDRLFEIEDRKKEAEKHKKFNRRFDMTLKIIKWVFYGITIALVIAYILFLIFYE